MRSPGPMRRIHGRVQQWRPTGRQQADDGRVLEGHQRIAKRPTGQAGLLREVDLVTAEVEQLGVDDREARLPAGLRGDAGDEVAHHDQLDLVLADHLRDRHVARVAHLGHHVIWLGPTVGIVGDGQQGLDDGHVRVVPLGREHDDGPRGLHVGDVDLVEVHGVAAATDDAGGPPVRQAGADLLLHVHLVLLGKDDHARPPLVGIGLDELGEDGEDLPRPTEDDGVAALEDPRVALAQLSQLALDAVIDDADEDGDHEDATQRDHEHGRQEAG